MKQNKFEYYLHMYLEWDPKKFKEARDKGLLSKSESRMKHAPVPQWLSEDAGVWEDEVEDFSKSNGTVKLIKRLEDDGVKLFPINYSDRVRVVCTPKGWICWCHGNELIHQNLIAYGMLLNKIPKDEKNLGQDQWSTKSTSYNSCLALEYNTFKNKQLWYLAESYDSNLEKKFIYQLQNDTLYDKVFKKLEIDKRNLNFQSENFII